MKWNCMLLNSTKNSYIWCNAETFPNIHGIFLLPMNKETKYNRNNETKERASERKHERKKNERTKARTYECTNFRMHKRTNARTPAQTYERTNTRTNKRKHWWSQERTNALEYGRTNRKILLITEYRLTGKFMGLKMTSTKKSKQLALKFNH